jgi:hypothetical protein
VVNGRLDGRLLLALLLVLAVPAFPQDGSLTATVGRATIRENESFSYVLRAEGRVAGQPDISAFETNFDILNRQTSTRIQTVNGRTEQVSEWTFQLMPRASGTFTLPPIRVGTLMSNAVPLEVLPALADGDAPADIFMEVEVDPVAAYVQSQVIYTLRLFVGVGTGRATLTAPVVSGGEAIIERLGTDRNFQTVRGERNFVVTERRYAIFPQEAGQLSIGPSTFEAMVIPSRGFSRVQRLRSEALEIEVLPAVAPPASHPNAVWLPARNLSLEERWADQADSFSLGVPRTRVLTIVAEGLLETQLPELALGTADGIRQYPDQPELERQVTEGGIEARRIERFAVIAQEEGDVSIPAAELAWWNVVDERWEVASVPQKQLPVLPGRDTDVPVPAPADTTAAPAPTITISDPGIWPLATAVFAALWVATLAGWGLSRGWLTALFGRSRPRAATPLERRPSARAVLKQLRAACRVNDAHRAQHLLLEWAALQFSDDPPTSLGALAERFDPQLKAEIERLEAGLYGRQSGDWSGARLAELLRAATRVSPSETDGDRDPLMPLYR